MLKLQPRRPTSRLSTARCPRSRVVICRATATKTYRVNFTVKVHVNYGESIGVVGNANGLGNWDIKHAIPLKWTDGDLWVADCDLEQKQTHLLLKNKAFVYRSDVEYKYIKINSNGDLKEWMPGRNLVLDVEGDDIVVEDSWEPSLITHSEDSIDDDEQRPINIVIEYDKPKTQISKQPAFIEDDRDANHSRGSGLDIGGPLDVKSEGYGPEPNAILESLVGSAVLVPLFPFH